LVFRSRLRLRSALTALFVLAALILPLSASCATLRIRITSPTDGETLSGVVTYAASARSANEVRFYVDGRLVFRDRRSPYSTRLDTRTLSSGLHVLKAVAVKRSRVVSSKIGVRVRNPRADTTPPSPPSGLVVMDRSEAGLSLAWTPSSDNRGVAGYDILLNGLKKSETPTVNTAVGDLACDHSYTLGVRAFDAAGNRSTVSTLAAATSPCGATEGLNWFPGYYVLAHGTTASAKQKILDDPLVAPFTGVQFRYHWSETELSPGD